MILIFHHRVPNAATKLHMPALLTQCSDTNYVHVRVTHAFCCRQNECISLGVNSEDRWLITYVNAAELINREKDVSHWDIQAVEVLVDSSSERFLTKILSIENGAKECIRVHCVDLGESFPTHIYLQNLASIQPRTSLVKFARSPRTDPPGFRGCMRHPAFDAIISVEKCSGCQCGWRCGASLDLFLAPYLRYASDNH